ncbi:universal stress protein [Natranaeroarchaeum sulfidigenes]|uniref:Nucleotide-binding protein, UspA family n=1 Tax=Natranaeroarchaeum sulfidigenes TaxID=2784880 RepID=A0A897MU41_9EURY|nr:universal stress protein [Natranaeroarchaeum sulfidigenes]QSG04032.1 Nucleotide-binding protein, UspA family [Natranaeroarchaeum sulfidigenes]
MGKTVLVAIDGSPQSEEALDHAITEFPDAELVGLTVIDPAEAGYAVEGAVAEFPQGWYDTAEDEAQTVLDEAVDRAAGAGVELRTATEIGRPANTIVRFSDEHDIDHIVMGSHGRTGMSRILLGSVAETVMRRSTVPVTVVR